MALPATAQHLSHEAAALHLVNSELQNGDRSHEPLALVAAAVLRSRGPGAELRRHAHKPTQNVWPHEVLNVRQALHVNRPTVRVDVDLPLPVHCLAAHCPLLNWEQLLVDVGTRAPLCVVNRIHRQSCIVHGSNDV